MKRKFSMFLNIAMLCLCVCAIAFGVYSAKTASLNVSGTVGFTAHNCNVDVNVSILGDSVAENGTTAAELGTPRTVAKVYPEAITGEDKSLDLGQFYFCDMTESGEIKPITITFTFTNKSDFMVNASVTSATADGVNIAKDKHAVVLMDQNAAVANKTQELTFTLTLDSNTQSFASPKRLEISIQLEKYTGTALSTLSSDNDFFWKNVATNTRSYVTMGTYTKDTETKDIRWYIFAAGNSDSNMNAITTNLDNSGYLPKGTYWFISEYVLDCDTANRKYGIPFDADGSQIYNGSDIQKYLNNVSESAATTDSFAKKYNFSADNNATYNYLMTNGGRTLPKETGVTNVKDTDYTLANQYFWLLSVTELTYLAGVQVSAGGTYASLIAQDATSSHTASFWWLRSPSAGDGRGAFYVDHYGGVFRSLVIINRGVRAAFQITIQA